MNTVSYFTVTAEVGAGQRIDNFLLRRLKSIPKTALTAFTVLERYAGTTLLQAVPVTGRTHQIRVHAVFFVIT